MSVYLSVELRQLLQQSDNGTCVYCQTTEANTGQALTVDHIVPVVEGGETIFANVCRACHRCNQGKGERTRAVDPLTSEIIALFHPRQQHWSEHFTWDQSGTRLFGLTATGRATIVALDMNNALIVFARQRWVNAGWHPPQLDGDGGQ